MKAKFMKIQDFFQSYTKDSMFAFDSKYVLINSALIMPKRKEECVQGKIDKVTRYFRGEKSGKPWQNWANWSQQFEQMELSKRDETRCPEGYAFPTGMPHPMLIFHGHHSQCRKGEVVISTDLLSFEHPSVLLFCFGMKVIELVKSLIGWDVTVTGRAAEYRYQLTFVRGRLHIVW